MCWKENIRTIGRPQARFKEVGSDLTRFGGNRSLNRSVTQLPNQRAACRTNSALGFASTSSGKPSVDSGNVCLTILQLSGEKPSFFMSPSSVISLPGSTWARVGSCRTLESYLSEGTVSSRAVCIVDAFQCEWARKNGFLLEWMMVDPRGKMWSEQNPVSCLSKSPPIASLSILTQELYDKHYMTIPSTFCRRNLGEWAPHTW